MDAHVLIINLLSLSSKSPPFALLCDAGTGPYRQFPFPTVKMLAFVRSGHWSKLSRLWRQEDTSLHGFSLLILIIQWKLSEWYVWTSSSGAIRTGSHHCPLKPDNGRPLLDKVTSCKFLGFQWTLSVVAAPSSKSLSLVLGADLGTLVLTAQSSSV